MKSRLLILLIFGLLLQPSAAERKTSIRAAVPERVIALDFNAVKGRFNPMFRECIGAGRANEGLRADWQQQLAYVKRECGFRYIRMHGLLTDDMGVYREDRRGNPEYNFQYIDLLYDYILSIGMKPFVELGFMPEALASGKQTLFWWHGNVTPPRDFQRWEELIRRLVLHFTERYGADEVRSWYFEVWNEPNLNAFWTGTQAEYFRLYRHTVQAIKSVDAAYRVGGPATAGAAWVPEMIDFCAKNQLTLDFISTHAYGVKQGYLDEFGNAGTVLDKNPLSVSGDVLRSRREIAASAMPHLELHYTEWSASYTPADPIHDSYHEAAYVLEKLKQVGDAANSMSYWVFTDIFEEAGPRFTPFHGGFGLLNYQGISKPAFFAFRFLNQLGNLELVNTDSCSWACKDETGNVQVLLWDFTNTHPGDTVNNQEYYIRDLPAKAKGKVKISVAGIAAGLYRLEISQVGYRVNDAYAIYLAMGKPAQLTPKQVEQIKRLSDGAPVANELVEVKAGTPFVTEVELRENDVFLVRLIRGN
ncbi:MAG TPA: glycoside hydrolase [bacterium]|nr:glycoside hydrolase [bacterium]HQG45899.1 glycoside hydrolase [bacterium]HQI48775.1 glycoside hydrolase [bacterium]HQJ64256.1 glycoside hydrolase [bacterium]